MHMLKATDPASFRSDLLSRMAGTVKRGHHQSMTVINAVISGRAKS
jgi:hypothetical protein